MLLRFLSSHYFSTIAYFSWRFRNAFWYNMQLLFLLFDSLSWIFFWDTVFYLNREYFKPKLYFMFSLHDWLEFLVQTSNFCLLWRPLIWLYSSFSRFGTWPVAMLAQNKNKAILEGPVCNGSQVIGWHTNEKSKRLRRFHVDMSGFAFNSTILWDPKRWRRLTSKPIRQLDSVKEGFQVWLCALSIVFEVVIHMYAVL